MTRVFMPLAELGVDDDAYHSHEKVDDEWCVGHFIVALCVEPHFCYEFGEEGEEVIQGDLATFNEKN